jgi:hypothetical protein
MSRGVVCDTQEQILTVLLSPDNAAALNAINDDAGEPVCVFAMVAYVEGPVTATFEDLEGRHAVIRKNMVIGFSLDGMNLMPTTPVEQYMAFFADGTHPRAWPAGLPV